jgi:hypothetical protein
MIFKLTFKEDENRIDWCQAKNQLHLLQSYDDEYSDFQDIKEVVEISDEEAKKIMLQNTDYDENEPESMPKEFSLYDTVSGDDFLVVGSTEWLD